MESWADIKKEVEAIFRKMTPEQVEEVYKEYFARRDKRMEELEKLLRQMQPEQLLGVGGALLGTRDFNEALQKIGSALSGHLADHP